MEKIKLLTLAILAISSKIHAEEDWVNLFDGKTLAGWVDAEGKAAKEGGWIIEIMTNSRLT